MIRKLLVATFYSVIVFCVISYITVMASLLSSAGDLSKKPVTDIGFPFKYYYQFWVSGSDSPNCGWRFGNFILDALITWSLTVLLYFMIKNRSLKSDK